MAKLKFELLLSIFVVTICFVPRLANYRNPIFYLSNEFVVHNYQSKKQQEFDDNIYLVNINDYGIDVIKTQIEILSFYEPSVIGLDYFPESQPVRLERFAFPNLVLPSKIEIDKITRAADYFTGSAHYGCVNLPSYLTFKPKHSFNGHSCLSFPAKMIELHDSNHFRDLMSRENDQEIINYIGNALNFVYLGDLSAIQPKDLAKIKGKIVLVGYLGTNNPIPQDPDDDDVHNSPRSYMYGVVLWANIIHTMLGNFIFQPGPIFSFLLCLLFAFLNYCVVKWLSEKPFGYWIIKLIQIGQLSSCLIVSTWVLHRFNALIDYETMTCTIVFFPEILFWSFRFGRKKHWFTA
jgi:CHASE2 domain-containing sensor protein